MSSDTIGLATAQESLLIPLYERAKETAKRHAVLHDPKAVELIDRIGYDFGRLHNLPIDSSVVRTSIVDRWVRDFLDRHPHGTIVEIGGGLNTRFDRVDNGRARWFDVDLPDSMALRRRYFTDTERSTMITASILEDEWLDTIDGHGPYLFVIEAVLPHLGSEQVRHALSTITAKFPGSLIALDTISTKAASRQERRRTGRPRPAWACDDPRQLEWWRLGLALIDSRTLSDSPTRLRRLWSARYRWGWRKRQALSSSFIDDYRMNLYQVADPESCHPKGWSAKKSVNFAP